MPSRAKRSIAACASLSTQPLFIAELPSRERNTPQARGADGASANLRQARGQLLPSARLLHQPERRGRSLSSLSAELDSTGSIEGAGAGGVKDGASSRKAWGAGSRTVERRRGGSAAGGSGTGPAICAEGASCGRGSAGACTSPRDSPIGTARGSLSAIGAMGGSAAATVAPPAPPPAAPTPALALAMRLCRLFGAAPAVVGLVGLVRSSEIMLARGGSKVGGLSWRELGALVLKRLAAFAATAAAPPSPPSAPLPGLACGLHLLARALRVLLLFARGGAFGIERVFCLLVVAFVLVLLDRGDGGRRLQRQRLGLLQAMHLLALFDHEGQLPAQRRVGIDYDGDAEALLQHAQMRALVIEEIERNVGARAHVEIVRRPFEQHFLERTQELQRHRRHRAHMARAAAMRALLGRALEHARANALARHFEQPEVRDVSDLNTGAIVPQAFLQPALDRAVVALLVHVDEVDDDQPGEIAQPQLPRDFLGGLEIGLERGVLDVVLAGGDRERIAVGLHVLRMARHEHAHELFGLLVGVLAGDQDLVDVLVVEVADRALDQRTFLVDERGRGRLEREIAHRLPQPK